MILIIDNYDSFTFNLVQYLGELNAELHVVRNDKIDLATVKQLNPAGMVISPGPGRPENAGISVALIQELAQFIPILGVCLGHQALAVAFHGRVVPAPLLVHGKTSKIYHQKQGIFSGLVNPFVATRYHSLVVERATLPAEWQVTAETEDKIIMAIQHRTYPAFGVQFHPESILTVVGKKLLKNFLDICSKSKGANDDSRSH
ncbi:MAG: anthranilate synthase component II [bacterium]